MESKSFRSTAQKIAVSSSIAVIVVGLQIALPWLSYSIGNGSITRTRERTKEDYKWEKHLRFEGVFDVEPVLNHDTAKADFLSATILKDDLILLLRMTAYDDWTGESSSKIEMLRVDIKTGVLKTAPVPSDVRHVLSDGKKLWSLPHPTTIDFFELSVSDPFLLIDRPVAIRRSSIDGRCVQRITEFVDGVWRNTDQYFLGPWFDFGDPYKNGNYLSKFRGSLNANEAGEIELLWYSFEKIYYAPKLRIGTREEAMSFGTAYGERPVNMTESVLLEMGLNSISFGNYGIDGLNSHSSSPEEFGYLIDRLPYAVAEQMSFEDLLRVYFLKCEIQPDGSTKTIRIPSPVPYMRNHDREADSGWLRALTSAAGTLFIISYDGHDGRLHFLGWDDRRIELIGSRGSVANYRILAGLAYLTCLAVMFPTFVLGLLNAFVERRSVSSRFATKTISGVAANSTRRGIARVIDISVTGIPLVLSIAMHVDFVGWWRHILRQIGFLFHLYDFFSMPSYFYEEFGGLLRALVPFGTLPILWHYFVAAIGITIAQIFWQGHTGLTLGKWIVGIRILRTTGSPCGFARSLLREILLAIDSLALLCWVPGVISILVTRNSQRIGDIFADTVVIRDRSPSSITEATCHLTPVSDSMLVCE